ncbi:MAG: GntR family transcriptional regulator [Acutalibacteraceae bacterium]
MLTYDLQAGDQPKYYRLYTCIREDILRAELLPGQKLPSKRALAEHLHISLATVSGAYEQLVDEGYLTAKTRSGIMSAPSPTCRRTRSRRRACVCSPQTRLPRRSLRATASGIPR